MKAYQINNKLDDTLQDRSTQHSVLNWRRHWRRIQRQFNSKGRWYLNHCCCCHFSYDLNCYFSSYFNCNCDFAFDCDMNGWYQIDNGRLWSDCRLDCNFDLYLYFKSISNLIPIPNSISILIAVAILIAISISILIAIWITI